MPSDFAQNKVILKKRILFPVVFLSAFLFSGWGNVGHRIISYKTILSALPEMEFFDTWADSLRAHASDADIRKSWDPNEAPKHYIDIDNYPEFISTGSIPQNFDSLVAIHGYSFVISQGILPWAILNTADSLKAAFEINNMHKAMLLAADIGHYVADAHMPLHITRNYNGQYTGQTGVHSRYESTLIGNFQNQIVYDGDSLRYIDNLPDYVFSMIYDNYRYVDSVLYADSVARAFAGNTSSTAYYNKFWEIAKNFTIDLFQRSSYRIACIIYTQWINGSPPTTVSGNQNDILPQLNLLQNYPNPFNPVTTIRFSIPEDLNNVKMIIYSAAGEKIAELVNSSLSAGDHEFIWNAGKFAAGVYICRIVTEKFISQKKMVFLK